MTLSRVVDALGLPPEARVDRRVPKTLLSEHGAPTPTDKRQIQDGIEEVTWVAALKPATIGVPLYRDDTREYLEVAVITMRLRSRARAARLTELVHRAIPYPVLLITEDEGAVSLSLAHQRRSLGESGAVVVETIERTTTFAPDSPSEIEAAFLASLNLAGLPHHDLSALVQAWIDRMSALQAAYITGSFRMARTVEEAATRHEALAAYDRLTREVTALRAEATRELQTRRLVDINLAIRRLETECEAAVNGL